MGWSGKVTGVTGRNLTIICLESHQTKLLTVTNKQIHLRGLVGCVLSFDKHVMLDNYVIGTVLSPTRIHLQEKPT